MYLNLLAVEREEMVKLGEYFLGVLVMVFICFVIIVGYLLFESYGIISITLYVVFFLLSGLVGYLIKRYL
jgi:hypothetical protein